MDYHTDHLGSSSWITYTDGPPVQYMSYMPFGESQIDQRTGDWNSRYTFSGKERDEETGYSYFGARYYDADLSIWLSRDPLADKYPYQSPYVYCGNNPLKIIDPDGRDEWEINQKGEINWKEKSDNHQLFVVDKNGQRIKDSKGDEKFVTVDKDIMDNIEKGVLVSQNGSTDYSKIDVTGKEDMAKDMFTFMSKNVDAEWSYWGGSQDGQDYSYLSTSHRSINHPEGASDPYSSGASLSKSRNGGLSFFFHTHPRSEVQGMFSNSADRNHSKEAKKGSPNAIFGVMHRGVLYNLRATRINWNGSLK